MVSSNRAPPPPRDLNVQSFAQARARELQSLHSIVAARCSQKYLIPRHDRRRTTSFARRKRRRGSKPGAEIVGESNAVGEAERKPNRRARRRKELREDPDSGFVASADGTRRLRTHLWHAKRFTMVKRWGFFLPLGLHGKGRGSRALLRWLRTGTIIHDASYYHPIELEGTQDSLLSVLKSVLIPSPTDLPEEKLRSIIIGSEYQNAMLHHLGAPNSEFIAPVIYMWRPSSKFLGNAEMEIDHDSDGNRNNSEHDAFSHQIWVWLHPAAFIEGFDVLRSACLEQKNDQGDTVRCTSLDGELAKFEIMGYKATETLHKLLHPAKPVKAPGSTVSTSFRYNRSRLVENFKYVPCQAILSLEVLDPRDSHCGRRNDASQSHSFISDNDPEKEGSHQSHLLVQCELTSAKEVISSLWLNIEDNSTSLTDSKLWSLRNSIKPPRKENIICSQNHTQRMTGFYMNEVNARTSGHAAEENNCHFFPILLLRHHDLEKATWWSIILPLKWARAFWTSLASSGVHAIGQRERRWIALDNKLPSYPSDFPDCKAYSVMMDSEATSFDKAAALRPSSVRPSRIPIPSPWNCLGHSVRKANEIWDANQIDGQSDSSKISENVGQLGSELHCSASPDCNSRPGCVILRALSILHHKLMVDDPTSSFPRDTRSIVPFPELSCISNIDTFISGERNLYLLRVLLCSFKEGSFENGAVVCAPSVSDILLWTSRNIEQNKPQIPQTQQYFVETKPGHWELEVPDDPSLRQSFRWPIGFVTTGFVRGSLKPVAEAFCEASLLARLRRQQKDMMLERSQSEIFVLVRNLRSTAYRLALLTVVLEKQKDDFGFM